MCTFLKVLGLRYLCILILTITMKQALAMDEDWVETETPTKHYEVIVTPQMLPVLPEKVDFNRSNFLIFGNLLCRETDPEVVNSGKVLLKRLLSEENDRLAVADGYDVLGFQGNDVQETIDYLYALSAYKNASNFIKAARDIMPTLTGESLNKWKEMVLEIDSTVRALFHFNPLEAIGSEEEARSYHEGVTNERMLLTGERDNTTSRFVHFEYFDAFPIFATTMKILLNDTTHYYQEAHRAKRILLLDEEEMKRLESDYQAHLDSEVK